MTKSPTDRPLLQACVLALAATLTAGAQAQTGSSSAGIFTCTDSSGRRITSDRPIRECIDREQAVLNGDGSVRRKVPPTMTAEERAAHEEQLRRKLAEENAVKDAIRLDRNLLLRYRDEASHARAREAALDPLRKSIDSIQGRITELERSRKQLDSEAEFYQGREMPRGLKSQFDANQASMAAQRELLKNQQAELKRVNSSFDDDLARLKRLWAGAAPGSAAAAASTR